MNILMDFIGDKNNTAVHPGSYEGNNDRADLLKEG